MLTRFAMTIWRAGIDAQSYVHDFAKRSTGSGIGYLYMLITTLAFFMLLPFAIGLAFLAPHAETFANDQLRIVQDWYPDDLVITISGGLLSTNKDEPVVLDLPAEWDVGPRGDGPSHAVTIDTSASIDDFATADTFVLLTQKAFVAKDDKGLRVYPYGTDENVVIDEKFVEEITVGLTEITPMLPWIAWLCVALLLLLLPWIVGGVLWAVNLLFLTWATLGVWLVSSVMGRGLRYGQLYRLGLFGLTSSLLLGFVYTMTGFNIPWSAYVLFFGWMIYVLSKFPKGRAIVRAAPPAPAASMKKPAPKATPSAKKPTKKGL